MEWLILILAFFFIGAIVVNLVIDVAKLACRVLGWIIEPKEWWSGSYIHGSFRPRLRTIVIEVLASIVMCALIFVSFVMSLGTSGFNLFGNLAVFGLFFLPVVMKKLWNYLRKREHAAVQRRRDDRAQIFRRTLSSENVLPKYCLYLRPFKSTGRMQICVLDSTTTFKSPADGRSWTTTDQRHYDFETVLAMTLDSYAPLVALGRPGEQVGAGRIETSEERWKTDFRQLADTAALILLMPSPQAGTVWELRAVLADAKLVSKTLFIIPPRSCSDNYLESSATFAANCGADPQYPLWVERDGVAFRWDATACRITFAAPLISYAHPSLWRFMVDLWLSRETKVLSGSRLKKNLFNVLHCNPKVMFSSSGPAHGVVAA